MQRNSSAKDYKKYQTKSLIGLKISYHTTWLLCYVINYVYAYSYRKNMERQ